MRDGLSKLLDEELEAFHREGDDFGYAYMDDGDLEEALEEIMAQEAVTILGVLVRFDLTRPYAMPYARAALAQAIAAYRQYQGGGDIDSDEDVCLRGVAERLDIITQVKDAVRQLEQEYADLIRRPFQPRIVGQ